MLPKSRRIERSLFPILLQSKRIAHSAHFILRFSPDKTTRLAVSVGKKVSKHAVVRNSVRRRSYAALRPQVEALPKGLYLFVAKNGADKIRGESLSSELESLLKSLEKR